MIQAEFYQPGKYHDWKYDTFHKPLVMVVGVYGIVHFIITLVFAILDFAPEKVAKMAAMVVYTGLTIYLYHKPKRNVAWSIVVVNYAMLIITSILADCGSVRFYTNCAVSIATLLIGSLLTSWLMPFRYSLILTSIPFVTAAILPVFYKLSVPIEVWTMVFPVALGSIAFSWILEVHNNRYYASQKALYESATHDALTGVYNRNVLKSTVFDTKEKMKVSSTIIMVDIDHFKKFNDTYGHSYGDKVLCAVVGAINEKLRNDDFICRFGGEEFIMFLQPALSKAKAIDIAERIRIHVQDVCYEMKITISVGVTNSKKGEDFKNAINRADSALYESKNSGRNRTTWM